MSTEITAGDATVWLFQDWERNGWRVNVYALESPSDPTMFPNKFAAFDAVQRKYGNGFPLETRLARLEFLMFEIASALQSGSNKHRGPGSSYDASDTLDELSTVFSEFHSE